ncbi:MAG: nucleoside recognition domain-containing protein [Limnochordia bacterium]|jgi:sporulation integral membrane protein YlbJ
MTPSRGLAVLACILAVLIAAYPDISFQASLAGLKLWFDTVLPALLPFFIMAELLMGLGVVHFLGTLFEPIMRPLFRIPGEGGFALAMSLAAGFPLGAKVTGDLARSGLITPTEGERLLGLAHTANSLFLAGAVAVGMFGRPELGVTLIAAHYLGAVFAGLCMRVHRGPETPPRKSQEAYLQRALRALDEARRADGRPLGKLFGDIAKNSFSSMLFIGSCIVFFSVVVQVIGAAGLLDPPQAFLSWVLNWAGLDPSLSRAILHGFFETTLGTQLASRTSATLAAQVTAASLILGWSGLSVHGQVTAMVGGSGIRLRPYFCARLLHAAFSAAIAALLMGPARFIPASLTKALPVLGSGEFLDGSFGARFLASARLATSFLLILVLILSVFWLGRRIVYISLRSRD